MAILSVPINHEQWVSTALDIQHLTRLCFQVKCPAFLTFWHKTFTTNRTVQHQTVPTV